MCAQNLDHEAESAATLRQTTRYPFIQSRDEKQVSSDMGRASLGRPEFSTCEIRTHADDEAGRSRGKWARRPISSSPPPLTRYPVLQAPPELGASSEACFRYVRDADNHWFHRRDDGG